MKSIRTAWAGDDASITAVMDFTERTIRFIEPRTRTRREEREFVRSSVIEAWNSETRTGVIMGVRVGVTGE